MFYISSTSMLNKKKNFGFIFQNPSSNVKVAGDFDSNTTDSQFLIDSVTVMIYCWLPCHLVFTETSLSFRERPLLCIFIINPKNIAWYKKMWKKFVKQRFLTVLQYFTKLVKQSFTQPKLQLQNFLSCNLLICESKFCVQNF